MVINVPKGLLKPEEINALKPQEREDYIRDVMLETLRKNEQGVTISEVMNATSFNRVTVTKHLEHLVAIREAYKTERGIGTVYFKNGKLVRETDRFKVTCGHRMYEFFKLENPEGTFLYIQEQEKDELRAINVKGGVLIPLKDTQHFLKGLIHFTSQTASMGVIA